MKKHQTEKLLYATIISGPSAAGKSTIAMGLWKSLPNDPAYICLDALKHMIFLADSSDHHLNLASANGLALMKNFLNAGHSVIISKAFCNYSYVRPFIKEALRRRIPVYYFKLKASLEELLRRNRGRQDNVPERRVKEVFRLSEQYAHLEGIEIDTEIATVEEIVDYIKASVTTTTR